MTARHSQYDGMGWVHKQTVIIDYRSEPPSLVTLVIGMMTTPKAHHPDTIPQRTGGWAIIKVRLLFIRIMTKTCCWWAYLPATQSLKSSHSLPQQSPPLYRHATGTGEESQCVHSYNSLQKYIQASLFLFKYKEFNPSGFHCRVHPSPLPQTP